MIKMIKIIFGFSTIFFVISFSILLLSERSSTHAETNHHIDHSANNDNDFSDDSNFSFNKDYTLGEVNTDNKLKTPCGLSRNFNPKIESQNIDTILENKGQTISI